LAVHILRQPLLGNAQNLRIQPAFRLVADRPAYRMFGSHFLPEIFLQNQFRQQEGYFVDAPLFEVVKALETGLADNRRVLVEGRDVLGVQDHAATFGESCGQPLGLDFVAVAFQPGEFDLRRLAALHAVDVDGFLVGPPWG